MGLFRKKKKVTGPNAAIVFVDYEHWFYSSANLYGAKPDVKRFRDELSEKYDIADMLFFGDFSKPGMRNEIAKIRAVSVSIIETQNSSAHFQKDFTDFIMLDHIYQQTLAHQNDIGTFIIFSGDGHFSSVVTFLKTKCKKEVGIYGVSKAISSTLSQAADWTVEVVPISDTMRNHAPVILENIEKVLADNKKKKKTVVITANKTITAVSRRSKLSTKEVSAMISDLISKGYITQGSVTMGKNKVKTLEINWDKLRKDGVYNAVSI